MPRLSYAQTSVPSSLEKSEHPNFQDIAHGLGRHMTDAFVGEIVGAGGAGGSLEGIPFEPAVIILSEATGPTWQFQFPGSAGKLDINAATGTSAMTPIPDAVQQQDGSWTLSLPTTLVPDGDTATLLCLGFAANQGL